MNNQIIEKILELTRYAPISEEGRIRVALQIDALYNPKEKPKMDEIREVIEENTKLIFYNKLSQKLHALGRGDITLLDYHKKVIDRIGELEEKTDLINQSLAAEYVFQKYSIPNLEITPIEKQS